MNRAVIISTTHDNEYLFFLPIVMWAWNRLGWKVYCFDTNTISEKHELVLQTALKNTSPDNYTFASNFDGFGFYEESTLYQCSRLYAADIWRDDYFMVSDVDMLPLSNYWNPDLYKITAWGKDLSDEQFSMCYIGAPAELWFEFMELTGVPGVDLNSDLRAYSNAASLKKEERWTSDQQILTAKLKPYEKEIVYVNRGKSVYSDYPIGRIDRSAWEASYQEKERIDCHLLRPGHTPRNWERIFKLIKECFVLTPQEEKWMTEYQITYSKLVENE